MHILSNETGYSWGSLVTLLAPYARIVPWEFPSTVRFLYAAATKVHACTRLRTRLQREKRKEKEKRNENKRNTSSRGRIHARSNLTPLRLLSTLLVSERHFKVQIDSCKTVFQDLDWHRLIQDSDRYCKVGLLSEIVISNLSRELRIRVLIIHEVNHVLLNNWYFVLVIVEIVAGLCRITWF